MFINEDGKVAVIYQGRIIYAELICDSHDLDKVEWMRVCENISRDLKKRFQQPDNTYEYEWNKRLASIAGGLRSSRHLRPKRLRHNPGNGTNRSCNESPAWLPVINRIVRGLASKGKLIHSVDEKWSWKLNNLASNMRKRSRRRTLNAT